MAAANSVVDVAMNAQGIELERRYERPVLSGLHAGHSFGFMAGGLVAMAAAAASSSTVAHFACAGAVAAIAGLAATGVLVRERSADGPAFARPSGPLLLLGLVAFCVFFSDGAANNWSAVHLRTERGADPALAAAAVSVFSLALGAAPRASGLPAPVAIAAVTTIGYLGSFTGPPVIGALAELGTLSAALVAAAVTAALAGRALPRPAAQPAKYAVGQEKPMAGHEPSSVG